MELKGDWIKADENTMSDLLTIARELSGAKLTEMYMHPALSNLIFEVPGENGWSEVACIHLVEKETAPKCIQESFGSSPLNGMVANINSFGRFGNTLHHTFEAYKWIEELGDVSGAIHIDVNVSESECSEMRNHEDHLFIAFLVVQYLLINHSECFSSRREYRKALTPPRSRELTMPYTSPGKVRLYEINGISETVCDAIRKGTVSYARHCPAWGVRGHYRHYASGAIVYIKPYIKGKKKDAYVGREYVLFPKTHKHMEVTE